MAPGGIRLGSLFIVSQSHTSPWSRLSNLLGLGVGVRRRKRHYHPSPLLRKVCNQWIPNRKRTSGVCDISPAPGKCLAQHCPLLAVTIITARSLTQGLAGHRAPLPAWCFVLMLFVCKGIPASPELLVKILNTLRIQGEVQREARGPGGHSPRAAPLVAAANANL